MVRTHRKAYANNEKLIKEFQQKEEDEKKKIKINQ